MEQLTGGAAAAKAYGYSSRPHVVKLDVVSSSFEGLGRSGVMVLVIAVLLPALIVLNFHYVMQRRRNLPPGPWPWPIFGNLPDMGMASKELPHRYFRALADKFGGLMYLQLGSQPCIVVSTVAVAKELFQNNDAIFASRPKRLYWTMNTGHTDYKNLTGAPYGLYWRQVRKLCTTELFSPQRHASYVSIRTEEVHHMMKDLLTRYAVKGDAVTLKDKLFGVAANNMTRMLTNKRYLQGLRPMPHESQRKFHNFLQHGTLLLEKYFGDGAKNQHESKDLQLVLTNVFVAFSSFVIGDYIPSLSFVSKLQGIHTKFENLVKSTMELAKRIFEVEKHREQAKRRLLQQNTDKDYVPDFVDMLLAAPLEDGQPLPDHETTTVLVDMLLTGTETMSNTVEWAMAELMLHPDVMRRAQDELDTVVGVHRLVQESDIPNLPYLQAIVKEALRLHTPAPLSLPHQSTQASTVLGFHLPTHTHLIVNLFAIHRDPSAYEDPESFDPQHFVDRYPTEANPGFNSFELIPFGVGRRMCPGFNLGTVMVSLLLAHLLHGFDWSLPEGLDAESLDMAEFFGITVAMKTSLRLVARPRTPALLYTNR